MVAPTGAPPERRIPCADEWGPTSSVCMSDEARRHSRHGLVLRRSAWAWLLIRGSRYTVPTVATTGLNLRIVCVYLLPCRLACFQVDDELPPGSQRPNCHSEHCRPRPCPIRFHRIIPSPVQARSSSSGCGRPRPAILAAQIKRAFQPDVCGDVQGLLHPNPWCAPGRLTQWPPLDKGHEPPRQPFFPRGTLDNQLKHFIESVHGVLADDLCPGAPRPHARALPWTI